MEFIRHLGIKVRFFFVTSLTNGGWRLLVFVWRGEVRCGEPNVGSHAARYGGPFGHVVETEMDDTASGQVVYILVGQVIDKQGQAWVMSKKSYTIMFIIQLADQFQQRVGQCFINAGFELDFVNGDVEMFGKDLRGGDGPFGRATDQRLRFNRISGHPLSHLWRVFEPTRIERAIEIAHIETPVRLSVSDYE